MTKACLPPAIIAYAAVSSPGHQGTETGGWLALAGAIPGVPAQQSDMAAVLRWAEVPSPLRVSSG